MTTPTEQQKRAVDKFIRLNRLHRSVFDRLVAAIGIHRSQHMLLMFLVRQEGKALSQKEIAGEFEISPAAVHTMLKKLEREGYIEKPMSEDDNRRTCVRITPKGREIADRTHRLFSAIDVFMFEDISENELEIFITCMEKMQAKLLQVEEGDALPPSIFGKETPSL